MFNIFDAYINALTEAKSSNKFNNMEEVDVEALTPSDIPLIFKCEYELPLKGMVRCEHCGEIFLEEEIESQSISKKGVEDIWDGYNQSPDQRIVNYEEQVDVCPCCGYGSNPDDGEPEYIEVTTDDLMNKDIKGIDNYITGKTYEVLEKERAKNKSVKTEAVVDKTKLEEVDEDYTKLKDKTKSEMLKYLKKNGLDVDNLIKTGIELESIREVVDKLLSDYTSPVISEYEQQYNKGLAWDYDINDNDIIIYINDF